MGLNDHPHPYGIVIGGNDLARRPKLALLLGYGNGTFIVRGMGPAPFPDAASASPAGRGRRKAAGRVRR